MRLLRDEDWVGIIDRPEALLINLPKKGTDWFSKDSSIQPASIDLHIGNILLPGSKENEAGSVGKPLPQFNLEPGQTVVVTSLEKINFPNHICGIGFPPSG